MKKYNDYRVKAQQFIDSIEKKKQELEAPSGGADALEKVFNYVVTARQHNENANKALQALLDISQLIQELE